MFTAVVAKSFASLEETVADFASLLAVVANLVALFPFVKASSARLNAFCELATAKRLAVVDNSAFSAEEVAFVLAVLANS